MIGFCSHPKNRNLCQDKNHLCYSSDRLYFMDERAALAVNSLTTSDYSGDAIAYLLGGS